MVTLEDKIFIKDTLNNLLSKIENKPQIDFRLNHESLYAWCVYQKFINEILVKYTSDKDYKKIEDIYNLLEIDEFSVSALNDLDTEIEKVKEYIKKIKDKIKL